MDYKKECGKLIRKSLEAKYGKTTELELWRERCQEIEAEWQSNAYTDLRNKRLWLKKQLGSCGLD
jgi:hypothetical protein